MELKHMLMKLLKKNNIKICYFELFERTMEKIMIKL